MKSALIQSVKLGLAISLWIRARFGWFFLIKKLLSSFFGSTSMLWSVFKTDVFPTLSISYIHILTSKPHLKHGHDGGYSFEHIPRFLHGFEGFSWINFLSPSYAIDFVSITKAVALKEHGMMWGAFAALSWICKVTAWNNCRLQKIAPEGAWRSHLHSVHAEAQLALWFILRNPHLTSSYKLPIALGKAID